MILVYLLFCIVIGLINSKTNPLFSLLLGILGLNFFINGNDMLAALQSLVAIPKILGQDTETLLLVLIIILLFILSNLLNLVNIDFMIDRYVGRFSYRSQQLITFLITFLSTNMDFSNSDIGIHHRKTYDINSGITPFLNMFSIIAIFISTILVMFYTINGIGVWAASLIVIFNVPAIWWAYKTLVQLAFNKLPDYKIDKNNMHLVRPSIEIHQSRIVQTTLNGKVFIKRCLQLLLLSLAASILIPANRIFYVLIIFISLLICYAIFLGVKAVYEERIMAEEEIYRTIQNSIIGIGPELLSFLLTLIFTSLSYDFLNRFYANTYSIEALFGLSIIGLLIGMILFKDYLIAIAMAMPISLIWISSNYATSGDSIHIMYISLISLATLIQIFYIIDFSNFDKRMVLDLSLLVLVTLSTIVVLYFFGLVGGITTLVLYGIAHVLFYMLRSYKEKNDNLRHS